MLIKTGDLQPIIIINSKDINVSDADKALKNVKEEIVKKNVDENSEKEVK